MLQSFQAEASWISAEIANQDTVTRPLPQFPPHPRNEEKTSPRQSDEGRKCCFSPLLPSQITFWLRPSDLGRTKVCSHLCCIFPGYPKQVGSVFLPCRESRVIHHGKVFWGQASWRLETKPYKTVIKSDLLELFFSHRASSRSPASTLAYTILFCSSWDSNSGSRTQRNWG